MESNVCPSHVEFANIGVFEIVEQSGAHVYQTLLTFDEKKDRETYQDLRMSTRGIRRRQ
jgi:hypothetical protein